MSKRRLLIVDDDAVFARTLARSFERRGYEVRTASGPKQADEVVADWVPDDAVVDLRLGHAAGLTAVAALKAIHPAMRIIVLTGFASIATAVEAIKLGAINYLTKPADTDAIEAAFDQIEGDVDTALPTRVTSIKAVEWEHIHKVLVETDFNISEAARRLGLHRRSLARKLEKRHF
jgi:two-component system, response regulator RegA